jgi:hypothetical protein
MSGKFAEIIAFDELRMCLDLLLSLIRFRSFFLNIPIKFKDKKGIIEGCMFPI